MGYNNDDFKYESDPNFDYTIDEKGNTFIALRKIKWGDAPDFRLDLRKYRSTSTGERMDKGFSFLTEDGPGELLNVLLKTGYGDTRTVLNTLKDREDFMVSLLTTEGINIPGKIDFGLLSEKDQKAIEEWNSGGNEEFYDPRKELLD